MGYMAFTETMKEAIWLRGLLKELGVKLNTATVYCDHQSAIHLLQNHVFQKRTKHINVHYHFVIEVLEVKTVEVLKVGIEHIDADALTKVVHGLKFQHCLELLSLSERSSIPLSLNGITSLALLKKKVGNGANTLFWEDCWINDVPLSRSFPRLYALELKKGITVADKLIDASFVASFRRNPRGGVEEEQLHHLVELVGSISLISSMIDGHGFWILLLGGIMLSHLLDTCNLARTLWRKIARWWEIDIPDFSCYEEWIAWFKTTRFSKAQKEMLEGVFYVMWWHDLENPQPSAF
ncbi:hypothetical protein Tco_0928565 [Tanacetum coccineum]